MCESAQSLSGHALAVQRPCAGCGAEPSAIQRQAARAKKANPHKCGALIYSSWGQREQAGAPFAPCTMSGVCEFMIYQWRRLCGMCICVMAEQDPRFCVLDISMCYWLAGRLACLALICYYFDASSLAPMSVDLPIHPKRIW